MLDFHIDYKMNNYVRKMAGAIFSKTLHCWHLPCDKILYPLFNQKMPAGGEIHETAADKPIENCRPLPHRLIMKKAASNGQGY